MITQNLLNLSRAIAEFEGWQPKGEGSPPASGPSVSYRNHNPGNLRLSPFALGVRDGFAYFLNDEVGMSALVWDLWMKAQGRTTTNLTGKSTINDLIEVWTMDPPKVKQEFKEYIENRTGLNRQTMLKELIL